MIGKSEGNGREGQGWQGKVRGQGDREREGGEGEGGRKDERDGLRLRPVRLHSTRGRSFHLSPPIAHHDHLHFLHGIDYPGVPESVSEQPVHLWEGGKHGGRRQWGRAWVCPAATFSQGKLPVVTWLPAAQVFAVGLVMT